MHLPQLTCLTVPNAGCVVGTAGDDILGVPVDIDGPACTVVALKGAKALTVVRVPYCGDGGTRLSFRCESTALSAEWLYMAIAMPDACAQ